MNNLSHLDLRYYTKNSLINTGYLIKLKTLDSLNSMSSKQEYKEVVTIYPTFANHIYYSNYET